MSKKPKNDVAWYERHKRWCVFLFAFLLYANTIPNDYNLDDELVTTTNPQSPHRLTSKGIAAIPEIFTEPYYKDQQGYAYDYRPVVLVTFAIEHSLFGDNIHVSHFINATLYALLCVLLFAVLSILLKDFNPLLPLFTTIIFAAHPIHTEVVASVKNRDEILALLFGLLAMLFAIKAVHLKKWINLFIALGCYFLALLSKQSIISFVVIIPLALILFTNTKALVPVLFSLVGALLYIPVSNFNQLLLSLSLASIFPLSILILYTIRNAVVVKKYFQKLISQFSLYNNTGGSAIEIDKEGVFYQPVAISIQAYFVLAAVTVILSIILFTNGTKFYLLPFSLLLPLAFMVKSKRAEFAFAFLILVAIGMSLSVKIGIYPVMLLTIYFVIAALLYQTTVFKLLPFVIVLIYPLIFKAKTNEDLSLTFVPIFTCFIIFIQSRAILKYYLFAICSIAVVSLVGSVTSSSPIHFLNVANILGLLSLVLAYNRLKKYIWIPVSFLLLINFILLSPSSFPLQYKTEIQNKIISYETPVIIEKSKIDRPINFVENVTDFRSSLEYKLGTAAQVTRKCTSLLLLPYPQSFYYGYKIIDKQSGFTLLNGLTIAAFFILAVLAVLLMKRSPLSSFSLFIFLTSLAVFSNILLPVPGMMADRFLLIPSLGFSILLAYCLIRLSQIDSFNKSYAINLKALPTNFKYTLFALLCVYSLGTIARNSEWKNHLTLFSADIKHLDESAQANNLYALQLMKYSFNETDENKKQEMWREAEKYFSHAIELYPFFNGQYDLARVQGMLGEKEQAEKSFYKAALLNPAFSTSWLSAGEFAMKDNRIADAREYYLQGLQHVKTNPALYTQLSLTYYLQAKYDSANLINKQGIDIFPTNPDFPGNIGRTFLVMNNKDSALYYFNQALLLSPGDKRLITTIEDLKRQ